MDAIKIFESPQFGQVRIITDDASGELLFCAKDVTEALGYTNSRKAVADHVEHPDVTKRDMGVVTGKRADGTEAFQMVSTTFVNESGVYALIFGSKQQRVRDFKHWVTSEVLPSIRKTGQYNAFQQPQASLNERMSASLTFADWSAKFLNLNDASKLGMAKRIGKMVGLEDTLPMAVNAGTEKPVTHASRDLLLSHGVGISTQAFNKVLEIKGIVKQATRPGRGGKVHKWMVLQPAFDKYGQNQQHPNYQQQTQIRWYDATFAELLTIVGLNKQTSLSMQ